METKEIKDLTDKIGREWEGMKATHAQAIEELKTRGAVHPETEAKLTAFNARIDQFEARLQRPAQGNETKETKEVSDKHKAHMKYLRKGESVLTPDERKFMVVGDDTTGGFGASDEMNAEIIKGIIQISPVRSFVSVRNTSKRSVKVMKRTGQFAAAWVGERTTRTETTGLTYGLEEIPTHELYAMVDISRQDLEDVDFDLESELRGEFSEQFALAEGVAVLTGNAQSKPEGLMINAAVAVDVTGDANNLSYTGLVDVSHNGKIPYLANAQFLFNLKSLGYIRKMVDGNGDPLWAPMASNAPATVLGFPYTIVQGMADVSAQNKPIAFGDFAKGYRLVDRIAIEITRDDVTQAASGAVRFWARKRLGGQTVLAEAYRILKVSV